MSFNNIIGNEKVKELLNKSIEQNNILHSYLFLGIEGIGKSLFAKQFAKMILCQNDIKPCNKCKSCIEFENNNNPDFTMINNDEKVIKIDQIREMNKKITEKPITSNKKVYIINNSDTMTKEAQNSLLKTLEEPPEYAVIILIASNENKLLNTIRSRTIKINFNKLKDKELLEYMAKNNIEALKNNMLLFADGSIEKVLKIKENEETYIQIENLINNLEKKSLIYILNNSEVLYKAKEEIYDILEYINILLLNTKEIEKINCIKHVEQAKRRLNSSSNYDMTIDNLLIKMWEEINEKYSRR
ncbi:MAG: DNA polymerase III subunit delta' [Clostridia bacterium]|nr:DNA polymerase III subunit delta' [Clostridia bacterium]